MIAAAWLASILAAASPAPSASPSPPPFSISIAGANVFVDQATGGPGTTPPEAAAFQRGSPVSPMSPYDWFNGAPVVPGVAGVAQYAITGTYQTPSIRIDATVGIAALTGSITNAAYWSEPLLPNINIHAESHALPYAIVFPTHAGQDDVAAFDADLLGGSIGAPDDSWRVRAGFFDLKQTDRFVFAPPPLTSVTPSLGEQSPETLGPGMPAVEGWPSSPSSLPLYGLDTYATIDKTSVELTDALLPSPQGTSARLVMGSIVDDRGKFGRYSFQLGNVSTAGAPIATTTTYGVNPVIDVSPQGALSTSVLGNQMQTIAGARAFLHPLQNVDTLLEIGKSWYDAGISAHPGTALPGWYEHAGITGHLRDDRVSLDFYRFDARYADIILPYGIPENIWSVAWSWPGVWLKSNFQIVDNTTIGSNRAGFRLHWDHPNKSLEVHAQLASYRQLAPNTLSNATQDGFVDGFFLVQPDRYGTIGTDRQAGLYAAWHLPHDDVVLDAIEDFLYRPSFPGHAIDAVNIRAPQTVLSLQHHVSSRLIAVGGYGRYQEIGDWASTPVNGTWGVAFAGAQWATSSHTALLVEARRYALTGLPSAPGGLPPTMTGTALVVDHRISI